MTVEPAQRKHRRALTPDERREIATRYLEATDKAAARVELAEEYDIHPDTVKNLAGGASGAASGAADFDHRSNGATGSCPWPGCAQPARWSRVDTRRRVPESFRVCFEHRAGDLSELPPLREGNAGPVAATLAMMVVEHPEGWLLRDAGRALGVVPSEVARVARELGLPVMHGRVWPAPGTATRTANPEPVEPARCRECSRPALSPDGLCAECHEERQREDEDGDLDDDTRPACAEGSECGYLAECPDCDRCDDCCTCGIDTDEEDFDLFDEVACARCGCTENAACVGGCHWVPHESLDLCSACATPEELAAVRLVVFSDSDPTGYRVEAAPQSAPDCMESGCAAGSTGSAPHLGRASGGTHPPGLAWDQMVDPSSVDEDDASSPPTGRRETAGAPVPGNGPGQACSPREPVGGDEAPAARPEQSVTVDPEEEQTVTETKTLLDHDAAVLACCEAAGPSGCRVGDLARAAAVTDTTVRRIIDRSGGRLVAVGATTNRRVYAVEHAPNRPKVTKRSTRAAKVTKRDHEQQSPAPRPPPPPEVQEGRYVAEGPGALGTLDEVVRLRDLIATLTRERDRAIAERTRLEVEAKQARLQLADADAYIESLRAGQPEPASTPREALIEAMVRRYRWLLDLPDDELLEEAWSALRSLVVDGRGDPDALRMLADVSAAVAALSGAQPVEVR